MWKLNQSHQLFGGGQELQIYWLPFGFIINVKQLICVISSPSETPNLTFEILFRLKIFSANIFKKLWLQTPGSGIPGRSLIIHSLSLTESYQELPVASALVRRQRENTGHVIPVWRLFLLKNKTTEVVRDDQSEMNTRKRPLSRALRTYFGEVADDVRSLFVDLSEDVEDEGLHIKIKRLVVEK